MKYIFMIATMFAFACFFSSETKGEMLAYGTVICLGIASFLLANENEKLKKEKGDEGR